MDILEWIMAKRSGAVQEFDDRFEVAHHCGEHSTIWKNLSTRLPKALEHLGDFYKRYDGMDLFSSTFKIAAIDEPKSRQGVELVFCLADIEKEVEAKGASFPEPSTPFMYQAGIGFYVVGIQSGTIYEWDDGAEELSDEFKNAESLFDEWLEAVE